jgi:pimeloyl-ACP methyl ester carboxylesterase
MIHGGGPGAGGWSNYRRNVDHFAERYRVILPDRPGFAKSDKPAIERGMLTFLASAIRGLMDALDIPRAHFVGNSLGGATTMKFALDYPDRIQHIVLMGAPSLALFTPQPAEGIKHLPGYYAPPGPSMEKLKAFLNVMVYDASALNEQLIKERFEASTRPDLLANPIISPTSHAVFEPICKDIGNIKNKTLVVWGRDDRTVTLDHSFFLLNQLQDVRLHVFGKCGHWAQWEKAAEFNRLVADFLSSED